MTSLADTILPPIRTRADLHRWSAANAHGSDMHGAIDVLDAAQRSTDSAEFYTVVHAALASAVNAIARADDSSGIIGDACRRLLAIHRQGRGGRRWGRVPVALVGPAAPMQPGGVSTVAASSLRGDDDR